MTSVNVTTQSNTVTVQQGDATTVTIATQGPQGPAGAGASDVVNDTSPQLGGDLESNSFDIKFADNDKALFGADSDLQIFHDGTKSTILDNGTGGLALRGENTISMGDPSGNRVYLQAIKNGAVSLRHSNVVRLETTSSGVTVTGNITSTANLNLPDSSSSSVGRLQLGDSQDLQIYHDTHSYIDNTLNDLFIRNTSDDIIIQAQDDFFIRVAGGENALVALDNGAVELYHNNVKKVETTADGVDLFNRVRCLGGTAPRIQFFGDVNGVDTTTRGTFGLATGANQIVHGTSTNDVALNTPRRFFIGHASNEVMAKFDPDGAVELYHDNVKRCETSADGFDLPDNSKLQLGNSQDLKIYHDATHSFIQKGDGTGNLYVDANGINLRGANGETLASFTENGSAELFHDNVKKLETTSSGITVQGSVTTQDMNMSNLNGTANEVDNTKGSWSIQEGADDLFLINRVSGKKYKFNLTEIS